MPERDKKRAIARNDIVTGSMLAVVGLLATFQALDFDSASRMFPAVASGLLALAGAAIVVLAVVRPDNSAKVVHGGAGVVALAIAVIAFWATALSGGAGFIIPTFTMQVLLLRITGLRKWSTLIGVAVLITTFAYLLFIVLLDVPLPQSRLPAVLQGF